MARERAEHGALAIFALHLCLISSASSGCGGGTDRARQDPATLPRVEKVRFATERGPGNDPVDDVSEVRLGQEIFVFVSWRNFKPDQQYTVGFTVYDGAGQNVPGLRHAINPTQASWETSYKFALPLETPVETATVAGLWRFTVFADDRPLKEAMLSVLADGP